MISAYTLISAVILSVLNMTDARDVTFYGKIKFEGNQPKSLSWPSRLQVRKLPLIIVGMWGLSGKSEKKTRIQIIHQYIPV